MIRDLGFACGRHCVVPVPSDITASGAHEDGQTRLASHIARLTGLL